MPKRLTLNQTVEVPVKAEHVPYSRQYHPHGDIAPEPVGPMAKVSSRTRAIMLLAGGDSSRQCDCKSIVCMFP